MRAIIDNHALRAALQLCNAAVNKRDERSILQCVLLRAEGDALHFASTNLNLTATTSADAAVRNEGSCAVNIDKLTDIAKNVTGKVSLELKERNRLEVSAGTMAFKIPALDAADFPTLPTIEATGSDARAIELSASSAFPMIRSCAYAETSEDKRFSLAGVLLEVERNRVTTVATDGHRLATCELPMRTGMEGRVLLPTALVKATERLSVSPDGFDVRIAWDHNQVSVGIGRDTIYCRQSDISYPQWRQLVPADRSRFVLVPTFDLTAAVKAVTPFGTGKSRAIDFKLWMGVLTLSAESPEAGGALATIDVTHDGGVEFRLTGDYFTDALMNVSTVKTRLTLCDVKNKDAIACVTLVQPEASELPYTTMHLIMPVIT